MAGEPVVMYPTVAIRIQMEWEHVDAKRMYVYQRADGAQPAHDRMGVRRDPTGA